MTTYQFCVYMYMLQSLCPVYRHHLSTYCKPEPLSAFASIFQLCPEIKLQKLKILIFICIYFGPTYFCLAFDERLFFDVEGRFSSTYSTSSDLVLASVDSSSTVLPFRSVHDANIISSVYPHRMVPGSICFFAMNSGGTSLLLLLRVPTDTSPCSSSAFARGTDVKKLSKHTRRPVL